MLTGPFKMKLNIQHVFSGIKQSVFCFSGSAVVRFHIGSFAKSRIFNLRYLQTLLDVNISQFMDDMYSLSLRGNIIFFRMSLSREYFNRSNYNILYRIFMEAARDFSHPVTSIGYKMYEHSKSKMLTSERKGRRRSADRRERSYSSMKYLCRQLVVPWQR